MVGWGRQVGFKEQRNGSFYTSEEVHDTNPCPHDTRWNACLRELQDESGREMEYAKWRL